MATSPYPANQLGSYAGAPDPTFSLFRDASAFTIPGTSELETGASMSLVKWILKEFIAPVAMLAEAMQLEIPNAIKSKAKKIATVGRKVTLPLQIADPWRGVGSRFEGEVLPFGGTRLFAQGSDTIAAFYAVVMITDWFRKLSKSPMFFLDELTGLIESTQKVFNHMQLLQMASKSSAPGTVCTIVSITSPSECLVRYDVQHAPQMQMCFNIFNSAMDVKRTNSTNGVYAVLGVDYQNKIMKLSSVENVAVGDNCVGEGNGNIVGGVYQYSGFRSFRSNIITEGSHLGFDYDQYAMKQFASYKVSPGTPTDLSNWGLYQFFNGYLKNNHMKNIDSAYTSPDLYAAIFFLMLQNNVGINTMPSLTGIKKGIRYVINGHEFPILEDRYVGDDEIIAFSFDPDGCYYIDGWSDTGADLANTLTSMITASHTAHQTSFISKGGQMGFVKPSQIGYSKNWKVPDTIKAQ